MGEVGGVDVELDMALPTPVENGQVTVSVSARAIEQQNHPLISGPGREFGCEPGQEIV